MKQGIVIGSLFKKAPWLAKFKEPMPEKQVVEDTLCVAEAPIEAASSSSAPSPIERKQDLTPKLVKKANLRSPLLNKLRTG